MKRKSSIKRKLRRTHKRVMYGGQAAPAPASTNIFANYNADDVVRSLSNFVQAAYSVKLAADAIKATSDNQNRDTTDPNLKGTRYLQRDSAGSFSTATTAIQSSLDNLYRTLNNSVTGPTLTPAAAPPPLGWAPPPSAFSP